MLITDASPWGLSAILMQKGSGQDDHRVVAYASRALSDVEHHYSQTQQGALAIIWAIERLYGYLYGSHFTLLTGCKQFNLYWTTHSRKRLHALNDGVSICKDMISMWYTQKEVQIPLISYLVIQ